MVPHNSSPQSLPAVSTTVSIQESKGQQAVESSIHWGPGTTISLTTLDQKQNTFSACCQAPLSPQARMTETYVMVLGLIFFLRRASNSSSTRSAPASPLGLKADMSELFVPWGKFIFCGKKKTKRQRSNATWIVPATMTFIPLSADESPRGEA